MGTFRGSESSGPLGRLVPKAAVGPLPLPISIEAGLSLTVGFKSQSHHALVTLDKYTLLSEALFTHLENGAILRSEEDDPHRGVPVASAKGSTNNYCPSFAGSLFCVSCFPRRINSGEHGVLGVRSFQPVIFILSQSSQKPLMCLQVPGLNIRPWIQKSSKTRGKCREYLFRSGC